MKNNGLIILLTAVMITGGGCAVMSKSAKEGRLATKGDTYITSNPLGAEVVYKGETLGVTSFDSPYLKTRLSNDKGEVYFRYNGCFGIARFSPKVRARGITSLVVDGLLFVVPVAGATALGTDLGTGAHKDMPNLIRHDFNTGQTEILFVSKGDLERILAYKPDRVVFGSPTYPSQSLQRMVGCPRTDPRSLQVSCLECHSGKQTSPSKVLPKAPPPSVQRDVSGVPKYFNDLRSTPTPAPIAPPITKCPNTGSCTECHEVQAP